MFWENILVQDIAKKTEIINVYFIAVYFYCC